MSAEKGWQELGRLNRARVTLFPSEGIETIETLVVGIWAVQMGCSTLGRERYFTPEVSDTTPFHRKRRLQSRRKRALSKSETLFGEIKDVMCLSGT